ncbi:hypothetical protein AWENTII_006412 [Aspergillus wentii]|nr:hypothetical protein MW887_003201 [Aspergillus wentii]
MNILQRAGRHAKAALRMVKTLLDYGADVNLTNCDGYTPLDYAIRRENKELIELLLTAGADVTNFDLGAESAQDEKSLSYILGFRRRDFGFLRPLSAQWAKMKRATLFAAAMDDRELLKKILHSGGKVDEPSRLGITALTASACRGNMEIAQLLLQHGADVNGRILTEGNNHALITPLHAAAKDSRMEMAKMLLASGASIDEVSSDGMTALDHAISRQDTEMTVFLLDSGAKPESSSTPETAIQIALRYRNMEVVKALIAAGADVNTQSLEMSSPLHIAVHMRGLSVVQMLVQAGADVNATDPLLGITPFHLAVSKGMADIAHYLLENGANLNFQSLATMASLEYAIMDEHIDVLHVFQQAGADFGAPDSYYLRFAQTHGKKAVVQYLHANYRPHLPLDYAEELTGSILRKDYSSLLSSLNSGAPVNSIDSRNQTPLMVAIMTDDIPLVEYLLGIGADPRDYLSLLCTVDKSSSHMLRILIAYCRCMDYRPKGFGCLALYAAILREKIEMVQILLEGRVNPNNRLSWGNYAEWNLGLKVIPPNVNHNLSIDHLMSLLERKTALDVAIYTGNMDIVELLLSHKDNAIGNHTIQSAVSGAVAERRLSVLPSLFKYVRDWNTPREGQFGRTLLQKTAEQGMLDIVKMILEAGADVNAPPAKDGGATALQAAAIQGHYGVVLCLLEKGGNVNAEPAEVNGRTAIEGAAEHGRIDILQLLLNAGARVDDAHYQQALLFAFNNGHFAAYRLLQAHRSSFDCDTEDS